MHLFALNIPELFIALWRGSTGKIKCYPPDNKALWDWAVFTGDTWLEHSNRVESLRAYLPLSYERPPRNPVIKINSGYKASKYLTYFYGYLPFLLLDVLPDIYLCNFYKLVRIVRLFSQNTITRAKIEEGKNLIQTFLEEFETIYVQQKACRMHFVQPCLHALWHTFAEIQHLGPLRLFAQ